MDNRNDKHLYQYKSIKSSGQNRKVPDICSSVIKCILLHHNRRMTNYKSIRGIKIQSTIKKHRQTQDNLIMQEYSLKMGRKKSMNNKIVDQDMIEIAKMKLHNNSPEKIKTGVKTEMTINRDQLQYFLRKKKPVSYTMSRSAQQIKKLFQKRIQVIISQLRVKTTQQTQKDTQVAPAVTRPINAAKTKRFVMRVMKQYQKKNLVTIQHVQSQTKAVKFLTQYQGGEVSGWQVQHNNEYFIRNTENQAAQSIIKSRQYSII